MSEVTLMQVLEARDRRVEKQKELLAKYGKTLICFTMNIPGPVKVTPEIQGAFQLGTHLLESGHSFVHIEDTSSPAGLERFYVLDSDPEQIKLFCTILENANKYGRLYDIDVITPDGHKVSRQDLGQNARRCLICNKEAAICGRSRAHSVEQLQQAVHKICADSICRIVVDAANSAVLQEVSTTPKPGLVDESNSGSHKDMDLTTFKISCLSLRKYFHQCAMATQRDPRRLFKSLRPLGMAAEKDMLAATGGVNTHKGAIFSMGIAVAAAARCYPDTSPETVLGYCGKMTEGLVSQDFGSVTDPKTVGEKLYIEHGITGIRGQAEQGFPAVLKVGYPVLKEGLRRGLSLNDAGCATLLHLLSVTDDTNLIHRSDLATLREIQNRLQKLLADDPYPSLKVIEDLDREFIERNLSPGGSADLLALTYFLHFLNN